MLKFWRSHVDYQSFVSDTISSFSETELLKLQSYSKSREKLDSLNLDSIGVLLAPYYSNTGRPAKNQPEILRSLPVLTGGKNICKMISSLLPLSVVRWNLFRLLAHTMIL